MEISVSMQNKILQPLSIYITYRSRPALVSNILDAANEYFIINYCNIK